jgi:hypothetical protein
VSSGGATPGSALRRCASNCFELFRIASIRIVLNCFEFQQRTRRETTLRSAAASRLDSRAGSVQVRFELFRIVSNCFGIVSNLYRIPTHTATHLQASAAASRRASRPQSPRGGQVCVHPREGCTAMEKVAIVILRFGTARQKLVLGWWTNPKPLGTIVDRAAI